VAIVTGMSVALAVIVIAALAAIVTGMSVVPVLAAIVIAAPVAIATVMNAALEDTGKEAIAALVAIASVALAH